MEQKPVLVTGATGYVGGRLVPRLLEAGYRVRAMGRSAGKLSCRPWGAHARLEIVQGDVLDADSLKAAAKGCRAAFYLVHSMNPQQKDFARSDLAGARNMVAAADENGLDRIVYLGGLGEMDDPSLSKHLRSRNEVAQVLRSGRTPATVLRAAMILGSGSASFEILRYLVDRLPVMITPKWVHTKSQPIAITNVLGYLQGCLEHDETKGQIFDIGGPDILTYKELMDLYAEEAGLPKRKVFPVPVLTPRLSSYWIHLVTPLPASLARPLAEGLRNPAVCKDDRIRQIIPRKLLTCREAMRLALERIAQERVETCWSDAGELRPPEWTYCGDAGYAGGTIAECGYRIPLDAPPEEVWKPIVRMGGRNGYYFGDGLWWLRGFLDRLAGGVGLRRGRRHPSELYVGDALDFWRVLEVDPPRKLVLLAEMKTPGEALLELELVPLGEGRTELRQLSRFLPRGLAGILYWYALYPFHQWIFKGMLKAIARRVNPSAPTAPRRFTPKLHHACSLPPRRMI